MLIIVEYIKLNKPRTLFFPKKKKKTKTDTTTLMMPHIGKWYMEPNDFLVKNHLFFFLSIIFVALNEKIR